MVATVRFQGGRRARTLFDALSSAEGPALQVAGLTSDLTDVLRAFALECARSAVESCQAAGVQVPAPRPARGIDWFVRRPGFRPADGWSAADAASACNACVLAAQEASRTDSDSTLAFAASQAALCSAITRRTAQGFGFCDRDVLLVSLGDSLDVLEGQLRAAARARLPLPHTPLSAAVATGIPEQAALAVRRDELLERAELDWVPDQRCSGCGEWSAALAGGFCEECLRLSFSMEPTGEEAASVVATFPDARTPTDCLYCESHETRQAPGAERWGIVGLRVEASRGPDCTYQVAAGARDPAGDSEPSYTAFSQCVERHLRFCLSHPREEDRAARFGLRFTTLRLGIHLVDSRDLGFTYATERALRTVLGFLANGRCG
ncbi:MAG: hypothetical protein QM765_40165 [Myxococcales bacterium]